MVRRESKEMPSLKFEYGWEPLLLNQNIYNYLLQLTSNQKQILEHQNFIIITVRKPNKSMAEMLPASIDIFFDLPLVYGSDGYILRLK